MPTPQTNLSARLKSLAPKKSLMPLTHTTSSFTLQKVLDRGSLQPYACPVMKQDLVYLFYGRYAYRSKKDYEYEELSVHAPIVLVLNPTTIGSFAHIFPFDTGNYPHGYQPLVGVEMEDFRLSSLEMAECAINLFWRKRWDYVRFDVKRARNSSHFDSFDSIARLYAGLLHSNGEADDRRGTIELSSSVEVPINTSTLLGIVLPTDMIDDPSVQRLAASGALRIASYNWEGGRGIEYFSDIRKKVWSIFRQLAL